MENALIKALADETIRVLYSDNICIGGKIPLPDGTVGIVFEETKNLENEKKLRKRTAEALRITEMQGMWEQQELDLVR